MWFILLSCQSKIAKCFPENVRHDESTVYENGVEEELENEEDVFDRIVEEHFKEQLDIEEVLTSTKPVKRKKIKRRYSEVLPALSEKPEDMFNTLKANRRNSTGSSKKMSQEDKDRIATLFKNSKTLKDRNAALKSSSSDFIQVLDEKIHENEGIKIEKVSTVPRRPKFLLTDDECDELIKKLNNLSEFLKMILGFRDKEILQAQKDRIVKAIENSEELEYTEKVRAKKYLDYLAVN